MDYNKKDLKFDNVKYFEDYLESADGIAEDLANFAGGMLYPIDEDSLNKFKGIMELPIYRGYVEEENGRHYVDAYKYKDSLYSEKELTDIINVDYGDVEFGIITSKEVPVYNDSYTEDIIGYEMEQDVEPFSLGISDLFYYKAGPDGKGVDYFEPYDYEEDYEERYKKSPFIDKYSVDNSWNNLDRTNFETISRAREMDLDIDGDNCSGRDGGYSFNLYDTLEEALNHHHLRIDKVKFENLTDEEMKIVNKFKEEKMNDETYLSRYGVSKKDLEEFEVSSERSEEDNDEREL